MIAGGWLVRQPARGKSEHRKATRRVEHAGAARPKPVATESVTENKPPRVGNGQG